MRAWSWWFLPMCCLGSLLVGYQAHVFLDALSLHAALVGGSKGVFVPPTLEERAADTAAENARLADAGSLIRFNPDGG